MPGFKGSRLDFLGGCCTGFPNNGLASSSLGDITSSTPGPPPSPLNWSIMLCISDPDSTSRSSSLGERFSSKPLSDRVGDLSAENGELLYRGIEAVPEVDLEIG